MMAGILSGVVAGGGGTSSVTFLTQPTVAPPSGTAGQTFTATPGTLSNGSITSREWRLAGNVVSTALTYVSTAAGALTYQEFAGAVASNLIAVTVTPAVTAMPSGVAFMYDPASKSTVGNGGNVTTWTDSVGGATATQTSDSTTPHTFVANAIGGLPAVRLSGAAVLETTGTNVVNTTTTAAGGYSVVVVMANVQTAGSGQANPCVAAVGTNTSALLQATPTETGSFGQMYPCGDGGIRTVALSLSANAALMGINGGAFGSQSFGLGSTNGQVTIGGWKNVGNACCGRADVLAIIGFNRGVTAADLRQIQRRYCDLSGTAYPGGANARHVSFSGDSLMFGSLSGGSEFVNGPGYTAARGLNLPWGTFDVVAVPGSNWSDISGKQLAALGNIAAVTGTKHIMVAFEYANGAGGGSAGLAASARSWINASRAVSPLVEIVFATSTDRGDSTGVANRSERTAYNAYWDTAGNRTGIDAYVQLHLDTNVGVIGACPTGGVANTYWNTDGVHNKLAGYALIDNGPYGLRAGVAARLAA